MAEDVIEVTVRNMVEADLRGIDSHGAGMLPTYNLRRKNGVMIPTGELTVVREFAATALLDAGNALGHFATTRAMEMACDRANQFGVGVVTVRRSNHYGAAGVYSTMAADRGMIGMCMTGSSQPAVLPTFAKEPRFSTNPIAVAAPGLKNEHFSLDMATSTVAVGKLNIARRAGKEIPIGWASDETGRPTADPVAALNAVPKRLSPIGGSRELGSHKGYGLGLVVEILCSVLSGSYTGATDVVTGQTGKTLNIGHFCLAINPKAFREEGEFEMHMDALMDWMRETPPLDPAQPVLVPGDPEHEARKIRMEEGIPMTDTLVKEVRQVAEEAGVPFILGI
jgi:LDH2 family malate/lactate/ureidoglycolate dehydrogenase